MSILHTHSPNFLLNLTAQRHPHLLARPTALLGPDERIWACSALATQAGVQEQMEPRQAQVRCPDLLIRPLDLALCTATQQAFLSVLTNSELPVEESGWGQAYVDLHRVTQAAAEVRSLALDLGRQLRRAVGEALQPSLGWDSGKFTARAAATAVAPGRLRLVSPAQEETFLAPLPITLLPLPLAALQQLHWLGIRTLGQFAQLPVAAVTQRFDQAGKLAQQWAQGHDPRPVRPTLAQSGPPLRVTLDPPTPLVDPVVAGVMAALRPLLNTLAARLEGCRRLRVDLRFCAGERRSLDLTFMTPTSAAAPIAATLTQHLQTVVWPGEVSEVVSTLLATGELPRQQLTLFPLDEAQPSPPTTLAQRLLPRYGPIFLQATHSDPHHPVAERRTTYTPLP